MNKLIGHFFDYDNGVMTYDDVASGSGAFVQRYTTASGQLNTTVDVSYDAIKNLVPADGNSYGLSFIHRYTAGDGWFLCMELCTISAQVSTDPYNRPVFNTTPVANARWDLKNGAMPVPSGFPAGYKDAGYFNSVYYADVMGGSRKQLSALDPLGIYFVQRTTLPWSEIQKLHDDNKIGGPNDGYNYPILSLNSCSSFIPSTYNDSALQWPHAVWAYMKDKDNTGAVTSLLRPGGANGSFQNNAADVGSMCPPRCDSYIKPVNATWLKFANYLTDKLLEKLHLQQQ